MTKPPERKKLQVGELKLEERCQTRHQLDQDTVHSYAALYRASKKMPEVEVFFVQGIGFVVIDGFHRVAGMRSAGVSWCWVVVAGSGTIEEATWLALQRNHEHGLARSNQDKVRSVELALDHPNAKNMSARSLAEICGVGDDLVLDQKKKKAERTQLPEPERVEGKDGKTYPAKRPSARATADQSKGGVVIPIRPESPAAKEGRREVAAAASSTASSASTAKPNGSSVPSDQPVTAAIELLRVARLAIQRLGRESPHVHTLLEQAAKQVAGIEDGLDAERPTKCPACDGSGCEKCAKRGWVGARVAKMMTGGDRPQA